MRSNAVAHATWHPKAIRMWIAASSAKAAVPPPGGRNVGHDDQVKGDDRRVQEVGEQPLPERGGGCHVSGPPAARRMAGARPESPQDAVRAEPREVQRAGDLQRLKNHGGLRQQHRHADRGKRGPRAVRERRSGCGGEAAAPAVCQRVANHHRRCRAGRGREDYRGGHVGGKRRRHAGPGLSEAEGPGPSGVEGSGPTAVDGSQTRSTEPPPSRLAALTRPPCSSTRCRTIDRPRPVPPGSREREAIDAIEALEDPRHAPPAGCRARDRRR